MPYETTMNKGQNRTAWKMYRLISKDRKGNTDFKIGNGSYSSFEEEEILCVKNSRTLFFSQHGISDEQYNLIIDQLELVGKPYEEVKPQLDSLISQLEGKVGKK